MSQYTLYIHSWFVTIGYHTGFTLEETTENGSSTRTIDLSKDKITGNIIFNYDNSGTGGDIAIGRVPVLTGSEAVAAFNKITIATSILDSYQLDYGHLTSNCNSSTEVLIDNFVPGWKGRAGEIFDQLPGFYVGDEYNRFRNNPYVQQALNNANAVIEQLTEAGIDLGSSALKWLNTDDGFITFDIDGTPYMIDKDGRLYEKGDDGLYRAVLGDILQQCLLPATFEDTLKKIKDLFGTAEEVRSPLVVDLDGDGVETVTAEGGVYFDHDANGFKENSGWVGQDDGILVRDINGNGTIDNGTELFGNNSVLSSGEKAVNGFGALKDLDDNNDGIFDRNDKAWNEVKIWQDKNFNGNYSNIKSANPVFV